MATASKEASGPERANLYGVLEALFEAEVVSGAQRSQLTHVVFSYLQSEIPLTRLYSHISSIVGYSTLKGVIEKLQLQGAPPEQAGADDVPAAEPAEPPNDAISLGSIVYFQRTLPPGYPVPAYCFASDAERAAFFEDPRISAPVKQNAALHDFPWHVDIAANLRFLNRVGHTAAVAAGYVFITGGIIEDLGRNGWDTLTVVNQNTFRIVEHDLAGSVPSAPFGTASLLINSLGTYCSSDCLLVFGGAMSLSVLTDTVNSLGHQSQPCDMVRDLRVLDLQSLRWSKVISSEDQSPSARCYPLLVPVLSETGDTISVFLFGGLGRPDRPVALDDAWLLDSTPAWKLTACAGAEPLFGATAVPAGLNQWLICGGYGSPEAIRLLTFQVERGKSVKASLVRLSVPNSANGVLGAIEDSVCGRRAYCSGSVLRAEGARFEPVQLGTPLFKSSATAKNYLYLAGGATDTAQTGTTLSIFEVISDGSQVKAARFLKAIAPQMRPGSPHDLNPLPRLGETMTMITHCPSEGGDQSRQPPMMPSFFVCGGFAVQNSRSAVPVVSTYPSLSLITLHSVDPQQPKWNRLPQMPSAPDQALHEAEVAMCDDTTVPEEPHAVLLDKRGRGDWTVNMFKIFEEQLRHNPIWLRTLNITPSIFTSLGSGVPWPFTGLGCLMENSCELTNRATYFSVEFAVSKSSGQAFLSVSDNGRGLSYAGVHKVLKRFGLNAGGFAHRNTGTASGFRYGLGTKVALSRLSQACLLISRTTSSLAVSLMSQKFLSDTSSATAASAPSCFWNLPSRDTVLSQNEHLTSQRQIFQYSPFKTVRSLAEQINLLGTTTGSRFIFFGNEPAAFINQIGLDLSDYWLRMVSVTTPTRANHHHGIGTVSVRAAKGVDGTAKMEEGSSEKPASPEQPAFLVLDKTLLTNTMDDLENREVMTDTAPAASSLSGASCPVFNESLLLTKASINEYLNHSDGLVSLFDQSTCLVENEAVDFPAWSSSAYSIDYNVATYMYWALLFNTCALFCNGWKLASGPAPTASSPFENTLYRHMKRRLHGLVELDWVFSPEDSAHEAYGLLGFLNPLNTLVADGSDRRLRYHEAGVLLYYKERLIGRMFVPFPAPKKLLDSQANRPYPKTHFEGAPSFVFPCTAIINVPEWLYPTAFRDDFVARRSPVFDTFVQKTRALITEYLSVCLSDTERENWIAARGQTFLEEAGRRRPLSPLLHVALLK